MMRMLGGLPTWAAAVATPLIGPPPPTGTGIISMSGASSSISSARRVPWPAITSSVVERVHEDLPLFLLQLAGVLVGGIVAVAVDHHLRAEIARLLRPQLGNRRAARHDDE